MREILFRGKAINRDKGFHRTKYKNGDWVYGLLTKLYDEQFENLPAEMRNTNGVSGIEIDYKTVGQYTGSTDKNGTKIFEGDVVDFYFFDKGAKNTKTMLIEWRDNGFWMRELYRNYRLADDFSIITEKIFTYRGDVRHGVYTSNYTYFVEVIGNIHDNPELLKGGAEK